jgi:hypothetical protein
MTHKHLPHARKVVESFRKRLSRSGVEHVGDKHFDELELMIESAISSTVLNELERAADQAEELARALRRRGEAL